MPGWESSALSWVLPTAPESHEPWVGASPSAPLPAPIDPLSLVLAAAFNRGNGNESRKQPGLRIPLELQLEMRGGLVFFQSQKVSKWKSAAEVVQPRLGVQSDRSSVSVARPCAEPAARGAASSPCRLRRDQGRSFVLRLLRDDGRACQG